MFGWTNREKIIDHIGRLAPFEIGSMDARWYPSPLTVPAGARLPGGHLYDLRKCAPADVSVYVVFSYVTPIAWRPAGGAWHIPQVTYSRTTSGHQSLARQGAQRWDERRDKPMMDRTS